MTTRLRPSSSLFRQALTGSAIFMTIVFVVLYFLTVPDGPWQLVLGMQVVISLAIALATWGYFSATVWVSADEISERGFFGMRRRFATTSVHSIVLATIAASGGELHRQLFVRDENGTVLVRMRGQFWSSEAMDVVTNTLAVPVERIADVTSIKELREQYPAMLFWFERHPVLALAVTGAASMAIGIVIYLFLRGIGAA